MLCGRTSISLVIYGRFGLRQCVARVSLVTSVYNGDKGASTRLTCLPHSDIELVA